MRITLRSVKKKAVCSLRGPKLSSRIWMVIMLHEIVNGVLVMYSLQMLLSAIATPLLQVQRRPQMDIFSSLF